MLVYFNKKAIQSMEMNEIAQIWLRLRDVKRVKFICILNFKTRKIEDGTKMKMPFTYLLLINIKFIS